MADVNRIIDTDKLPPHSLEAERAVLGTLVVDNTTIPQVEALIMSEDFYRTEHQLIFENIIAVYHRDGALDLTTLCDELERNKVLDKVGGPGYVASLEDYVITSANIEHHTRIVLNKSRLRKLIEAAHSIVDQAYNEVNETEDILESSEKLIFDVVQQRTSQDFVAIGEIAAEAMDEISKKYHHKEVVTGIASGYQKLDDLTCGFQPSDLIIIAARPSMGKTAFALNISMNVAQRGGVVGLFSLEMSSQQLNHRLLCTLSMVSGHRLRTGYIAGKELRKITDKAKVLSSLPIFVDDTPGLTSIQLRARAHRLKAKEPDLSLIIVDYLQLMRSGTRIENRQQEVADISHSLKCLARELDVPVIALSQLSRLVERRKDKEKRPVLSDLRESGAIEQDADLVMFVHRPDFDKRRKENMEETNQAMSSRPEPGEKCEIIIGKQRNGPIGSVNLIFFPDFTLFATPAGGI